MATKKRASGGPVKTVIWWVVLAMVGLAIWRSGIPHDPKGLHDWFANFVPGIEKSMTDAGKSVESTIKGVQKPSAGASPAASPAASPSN